MTSAIECVGTSMSMITLDSQDRMCLVCGASLANRRSDAQTCGGACRAALSRVKAEEPAQRFWTAYAVIRRPRSAQRRTQGGSVSSTKPGRGGDS